MDCQQALKDAHRKLESPEVMTCSATPSPGISVAKREPPASVTRDGSAGCSGGCAVRLRRGGCSWNGPKSGADVPLAQVITFVMTGGLWMHAGVVGADTV